MKHKSKIILSALFAATTLYAIAPSILGTQVIAQSVDAKSVVESAKAQGLVGEQIDGYLGFVKSDVPQNIRAAVNEINIKRKSVYTKIARDKGVSVSDVAGLSGEKLIAKAKPGQFVKLADGNWHKV